MYFQCFGIGVCVHIFIHLYMSTCARMCVHVYVYACGDQKLTLGVFFSCFPLYFEPGSLTDLGAQWLLWVSGQWASGSSCLRSPALGLQVNTAVPGFLHGFWGSKFMSSCLSLPHWAISLPWMLRHFIEYKICLQFEDKCVHGIYPQSSVTGRVSQWVLTLTVDNFFS